MLIVTLSTIPSRFESISRTIDSLLAQDIKVDAIELYLPKQYRRFPDWKQTVPALDSSVDVVMIDTDLGPATKVLPACERYAGKSVDILYCDDDQIYPPGWARSFIDARRYHPNEAIAVCGAHVSSLGKQYTKGLRLPRAVKMRTIYDFSYLGRRARQIFAKGLGLKVSKPRRNHFFRKSGFIDIAAGFGGVLVKPEMFDSVAFDIPSKLWTVDDIWLSGMLARKGIGIWGNSEGFLPIPHEGSSDALQFSVIEGFNRHQADLSCFEYLAREYRIWSD